MKLEQGGEQRHRGESVDGASGQKTKGGIGGSQHHKWTGAVQLVKQTDRLQGGHCQEGNAKAHKNDSELNSN